MSYLSLADTSAVYTCSREVALFFHSISCDPFKAYVRSLRRLRVTLSEYASLDPWPQILDIALHFQFLCFGSPLPFSHPALRGVEALDQLSALLPHVQAASPDYVVPTIDLRDHLAFLVQSDQNPLLSAIEYLLAGEPAAGRAIVVRFSRLIPAIQAELMKHPALRGMEVVHPSELERSALFEALFVIGSASSYREDDYVLTAPRARWIEVLRYSFVRDSWKASPAFPRPRLDAGPLSDCQIHESGPSDDESFEVEAYRPDIKKLLRRIIPAGSRHEDLVDAVFVSLEGDHAVFLDSDEDSWAIVIDLRADEASRVRRVRPASKLDRGMFLLLRTEGGSSDYIAPVADRILGGNSRAARDAQKLWKQRLRSKVELHGAQRVETDLQRLGVAIADYQNIRNWMSYTHIRTKSRSDFDAILQYTGLEAQSQEIWDHMSRIRAAHVTAGQQIRRLLLEQVTRADLRQLQKLGMMGFELPSKASGSLTAYRVEAVSSEAYTVPTSHLGRPFNSGSI